MLILVVMVAVLVNHFAALNVAPAVGKLASAILGTLAAIAAVVVLMLGTGRLHARA